VYLKFGTGKVSRYLTLPNTGLEKPNPSLCRAGRPQWTHPAVTPARQAGTRLTYHGGMEGW